MHAGRVLAGLERLDRELQAHQPHPVMDVPSLHASTIHGGREWSVYPDFCRLQVERRTVAGESAESALGEITTLLERLRAEDGSFEASARVVFSRPPYETPTDHHLVASLERAMSNRGVGVRQTGMSFWTDAAVLGEAGTPAVLFGPGGAGLHSIEEYVRIDEVIACRDVLADLAVAMLGSIGA
jgi:acetylornithine deacetylase